MAPGAPRSCRLGDGAGVGHPNSQHHQSHHWQAGGAVVVVVGGRVVVVLPGGAVVGGVPVPCGQVSRYSTMSERDGRGHRNWS